MNIFQVSDRAVEILEGSLLDENSPRTKTNGKKTTQYLFSLGATYLQE